MQVKNLPARRRGLTRIFLSKPRTKRQRELLQIGERMAEAVHGCYHISDYHFSSTVRISASLGLKWKWNGHLLPRPFYRIELELTYDPEALEQSSYRNLLRSNTDRFMDGFRTKHYPAENFFYRPNYYCENGRKQQ